jgi:hypothetical protein
MSQKLITGRKLKETELQPRTPFYSSCLYLLVGHESHKSDGKLEASASSGRSGAMGETAGRATGYNTRERDLEVIIMNKEFFVFWFLFLGVLSWAVYS